MSVMTDWCMDYQKENKCSLVDAVQAWKSLPDDHQIKIREEDDARIRNNAKQTLASLEILLREIKRLVDQGWIPSAALDHPSITQAFDAIEKSRAR